MPGLVPFMACLLALVVYDIIKIFIQRGWSFGVLFRPAEYYYLSILHSRAKEKLLSGTDKEDIVRSLRQEKYPFMMVPPKDEKTIMALSFVERVLADDDALKQYLVKYDFSYDDFKDLQKKVAEAVKSKIGFTPIVYVVELGFLPRSEKKTKRVLDERFA